MMFHLIVLVISYIALIAFASNAVQHFTRSSKPRLER